MNGTQTIQGKNKKPVEIDENVLVDKKNASMEAGEEKSQEVAKADFTSKSMAKKTVFVECSHAMQVCRWL